MEKSYNSVAFSQDTPLIFPLAAQEATGKGRTNGVKVAFPLIAYRVLIRIPVPHILNLFQTTILKLLNTKSYSDVELAELLCLDQSLVAFVIEELTEMGYLNDRRVSQEGKAAISDTAIIPSLKTGYVFYDPFSEEFLDCFLPGTDYHTLHTEYQGEYISIVTQENAAKGSTTSRALLLHQNIRETVPPLLPTEKGLSICRSAAKSIWFQQNKEFSGEEKRFDPANFDIQVTAQPEPVIAVTIIYKPKNHAAQWTVSDPFSLNPSLEYTERISTLIRNMQNPELTRLVNRITENTPVSENKRTVAEVDFAEEKNKEEKQISRFFGNHPNKQIIKRLTAAALCYKELIGKEGEKQVGKYISSCYSSVEQALAECFRQSLARVKEVNPELTIAGLLSQDCQHNGAMLEELAVGYCGFHMDNDIRIRDFLGSIKRYSIVPSEEASLLPMLAGCLLLAKFDAESPFNHTEDVPDFISDMIYLKQYRDPFEHEGIVRCLFDEVSDCLKNCIRYVSWLLCGKTPQEAELDEYFSQMSKPSQPQNIIDVLHDECLKELQSHGILINYRSAVLDSLIACCAAVKQANDEGFIMAAASFLELIVKSFPSDKPTVIEFIEKNRLVPPEDAVSSLCAALDCLPENKHYLNEFFKESGIYNYYREKAVCSSALFYRLVCAAQNRAPGFESFIRGRKDFISDICLVHYIRGHNCSSAAEKQQKAGFGKTQIAQMLERFYDYFREIQ